MNYSLNFGMFIMKFVDNINGFKPDHDDFDGTDWFYSQTAFQSHCRPQDIDVALLVVNS